MQNTSIRAALAVFLGGVAIALTNPRSLNSATSIPQPSYRETAKFTTTIPNSRGKFDEADIYYPIVSKQNKEKLPVALLLQGALVDRADYANYANIVASYGFIVIVPDRVRSVSNPQNGEKITGLLAETSQIDDTLNFVRSESLKPSSPIDDIIDPDKLTLLGHSWGGAVGLSAIDDSCRPVFCENEFTRPEELVGAVFFGTNLRNQTTNKFIEIDNDRIPVALIQGDIDGVALPDRAYKTYQSIQDPPKALITVKGVNHYGMTNEDSPRDPVRPTLDQNTATETIARWSAIFLLAKIEKDPEAIDYFSNSGDALDRNVTVTSDR